MTNLLIYLYTAFYTLLFFPQKCIFKMTHSNEIDCYNFAYHHLHHLCKNILKIRKIKVEVNGFENLPSSKEAVLFISNHKSNLDSIILIATINTPFSFIGKSELKTVPIISWWFQSIGSIFLSRDDIRGSINSINTAATKLRNGQSFLIYPEGKRVFAKGLLPFKAGSFKIATKSKKPIIPVGITGSENLLEKPKTFISGSVFVHIAKLNLLPLTERNTTKISEVIQSEITNMLNLPL